MKKGRTFKQGSRRIFNYKKYKRPSCPSLVQLLRGETNNKTTSFLTLRQWSLFILKSKKTVFIRCKFCKRHIFSRHTPVLVMIKHMASKIRKSLRIFLSKIPLQDISRDRLLHVLCLEVGLALVSYASPHSQRLSALYSGPWMWGPLEVKASWGSSVGITQGSWGNVVPQKLHFYC